MSFEYYRPAEVGEAIALKVAHKGKCAILAGGTDLVVQWRTGAIELGGVIDLGGVEELKAISVDESHVHLGAMATHARIAGSTEVARYLPALAEACRSIGGAQIQNVGTIGGNVMNASPAGDTLPVLLAHEAEFQVKDLKGESWIPAEDFFTSYRATAVGEDQLLTSIRIPKSDAKERSAYYKIGQRRAQAISKVSMCVRGRVRHGGVEWIRIALGSVAATPVRALGTEALLAGKVVSKNLIETARASLADELAPIDDIRSTAEYRRFAAAGLIARYLRWVSSS